MKRYFTCLFVFIVSLFLHQNISAQSFYLLAYDDNDVAIQGTSTAVNTVRNVNLIDVLSMSEGVYCGSCTEINTSGKKQAEDLSFTVANGPEITKFRQMLNAGKAATRLYFVATKPGGGDTVKAKNNSYIIALGYCTFTSLLESGSSGEPPVVSISVHFDGVAYYYRKPALSGDLPITPTSVVTWNFLTDNATLDSHTTPLALPGGY